MRIFIYPVKPSGFYKLTVEETPEKLLNELPKGQGIRAETLRQKDGASSFIRLRIFCIFAVSAFSEVRKMQIFYFRR